MSNKIESFGDSFVGVVILIVVLFFLFEGEPDIFTLAKERSFEWLSANDK